MAIEKKSLTGKTAKKPNAVSEPAAKATKVTKKGGYSRREGLGHEVTAQVSD